MSIMSNSFDALKCLNHAHLPDKLSHLSIWRGEIETFTPAPIFSDKQIQNCIRPPLPLGQSSKNYVFYGFPMFKEMSQVNMAFNEENFGGDFDQLLRQQSLSSACILIIGLYDIQFGLKYSSLTFYTTHHLH